MFKLRAPKGRSAAIGAGAAVLLALTGCSGSGTAGTATASLEDMDPVTLTIPEIESERDGTMPAGLRVFMDKVTERTGGKIKFDVYYSASLMPGDEMLSAISSGSAHMGRLVGGYFPQELPMVNWYDQADRSLGETAYPHAFIAESAATQFQFMNDGPLRDELASHNLTALAAPKSQPHADLLCKEPVKGLEDLKGRLIRTATPTIRAEVEHLGGVSVSMPTGDVYEGLERGVIDCAVIDPPSFIRTGAWEVAKYYVPAAFSMNWAGPVVINTDVWEGFPEEVRQIFRENAPLLLSGISEKTLESYARFATEGVEKHGIVFEDPREIEEALKGHQQQRYESMVANAPAGVTDPAAFKTKLDDELARWFSIAGEELTSDTAAGRSPEAIREAYIAGADNDLTAFWKRVADENLALAAKNDAAGGKG